MSDPDAELGWVNRPGIYSWGPSDPDLGGPIQATVASDRSRGQPIDVGNRPVVWLMGGSFAFGFGVGDGEDLGSALGRQRPDLAVLNFGTPGYGTVQSQGLYRQLRRTRGPPALVVYGLVYYHDSRNVAAPSWLYALDRSARNNAWVRVPSASLGDGGIALHPPRAYAHWPLSERFAVVHLVERAAIALADWGTATKTEVTLAVVQSWRDEIEADGGRLIVALLHGGPAREAYLSGLRAAGIKLVDAEGSGGFPDPAFVVPWDGHPNGDAYEIWAAPIGGGLWSGRGDGEGSP